jgi:hypothetical protein
MRKEIKIKKIISKPFGCGQGYTQENKMTIPFWHIDYIEQETDNTCSAMVSCEFLYDLFRKSNKTEITIEDFELELKAGNIKFN